MTSNTEFTAFDHQYMSLALQLAAQGLYSTSPNPRVGCVIVKDGVMVGQGAHLKAGEAHAEVHALAAAGANAAGATAYVTLEPCSHHGRTPPCAAALIEAGVQKVIAAMQDPNPLVAGQGLTLLSAAGIQTAAGLMQAQAEALNPGFIKRMRTGLPYVRAKIASSLDGKTALENGESQWITSAEARQDVQHWRAQSCAVITGIGTVLADNPQLNVRIDTPRQPLRVVIDSTLRCPADAQILQGSPTLIVYATDSQNHASALQQDHVNLLAAPNGAGQVDLRAVLAYLAEQGINEVMIEAGANLSGAFLEAQLVDALVLYMAPKIMGHHSRDMLNLLPYQHMTETLELNITDTRMVGRDLRLLATPIYPSKDAD